MPDNKLVELLSTPQMDRTELDKVIELMLKPENIGHLTELNRSEIAAYSALAAMLKAHPELSMLRDYMASNLVYRVSKGRNGRKETIKLVSRQLANAEQMMEADGQRTGWRRFFRR